MEQNKVRSYILYAIGETLLVVIGILNAENLASPDSYRDLKGGFSNFGLIKLNVTKLRADTRLWRVGGERGNKT